MKTQHAGIAKLAHPAILTENGSNFEDSPYSVKGPHYFVIMLDNSDALIVVPCFSKPGFGRVEVPSSARKGHPAWTSKPCFICFTQLCLTTFEALKKAAHAANDKSTIQTPNSIDLRWLASAYKQNFLLIH